MTGSAVVATSAGQQREGLWLAGRGRSIVEGRDEQRRQRER